MVQQIVEIYSKTCPSCKEFYGPNSTYSKVKKECCRTVPITRVDADTKQGEQIVKQHKIEWVPTILVDNKPIDPTVMSKKQLEKLLCADHCPIT